MAAALRSRSVSSPAPWARQPGRMAPGGERTPSCSAETIPRHFLGRCRRRRVRTCVDESGDLEGGACGRPSCPTGDFLYLLAQPGGPSESGSDRSTRRRRTRSCQADSRAVYAAPGYLLFARESTLMAQTFDLARVALPARDRGGRGPAATSSLGQSDFRCLKWSPGLPGRSHAVSSRLVRRDGTEIGQVGDAAHLRFLRLSPDGEKVAVDILDRGGDHDIALFDLARGAKPSFVTMDPMADWTPVFSPDGKQLASRPRGRARPRHVKDLNSANDAEPILRPTGTGQFVSDWSTVQREPSSSIRTRR